MNKLYIYTLFSRFFFPYRGLWNFKAGRAQKVYLISVFQIWFSAGLWLLQSIQWQWHWFLRLGHKSQAALVLMECWLSMWSLLKGSRHALGSPRHRKRPQVGDLFEAWGEPRFIAQTWDTSVGDSCPQPFEPPLAVQVFPAKTSDILSLRWFIIQQL